MPLSPRAWKIVRASGVLIVSLSYLAFVFRLFDGASRTSGLGDWQDPYFINALLEHWYRSATRLSDPSSPPMFFPARGTLAYSHGLVLYAPFYAVLRPFFHPFHAYTWTLFAVIETGILCLYVVLRKLGLSFVESLLLAAFFFSSQNVVGGEIAIWSQRASVFLIPPILLLLLVSARLHARPAVLLVAGAGGFLATLMYVQDFYTAHFAALFAVTFGVFFAMIDLRPAASMVTFWRAQPRASRLALAVIGLASLWAGIVLTYGGGEINVLGIRLRSHDWRRPALIALAASVVFLALNGRLRSGIRLARSQPWLWAAGVGAAAGAGVFLQIYLGAYAEHRAFPEEHLLNSLLARDPSRWDSPLALVHDLDVYSTPRSFLLVAVGATLAWIPRFKVERKTRIYCLLFLAISLIVLLIPLRFPFSVWRAFFEHLPGFGVIRDPRRVIQIYELAVALAAGLFVARLRKKSAARLSIALLVFVLLVAARNRSTFDYQRPLDVYERWVAAPIDIDPRCTSFYIKGASAAYMSRASYMWTLYAVDSLFVSLNQGIPTLNGYSAWVPDAWDLFNPSEPEYVERVQRWIAAKNLRGVCGLDIDARTMR